MKALKETINPSIEAKYRIAELMIAQAKELCVSERELISYTQIPWSTYMRDKKLRLKDKPSITEERLQTYAALCDVELKGLLNYVIRMLPDQNSKSRVDRLRLRKKFNLSR